MPWENVVSAKLTISWVRSLEEEVLLDWIFDNDISSWGICNLNFALVTFFYHERLLKNVEKSTHFIE